MTNPCSRCTASRSICSGPVEGAIFVNRHSVGFTDHSQREVLKDALIRRRHYEDTPKVYDTSRYACSDFGGHKETMPTFDYILNRHTARMLYASLLQDFYSTPFAAGDVQPTSTLIYSHSAIAICLRNVMKLGSAARQKPGVLDYGVFSLLNLYFGKAFSKHQQLIDLSRKFYNLTVQALYASLSKLESNNIDTRQESKHLAQDTFCLSLVLILFELVNAPTATSMLDMHIDGALSILQQTGPSIFEKSSIQRQLLSGFRGIAYASAARRRLSLFLDEPQWLDIFRDRENDNYLDHLYNIAVRLPRLLEQTKILTSMNPEAALNGSAGLLSDYATLRSMFQSWYLQQLSRNTESTGVSTKDQKNPSSNEEVEDKNMLHLSTMMIELDMGLTDLLSSSPQQSTFAHITSIEKEYQIMDTQKLLYTMSKSVQLLRSSNEGQLLAAIPSETLKRYKERTEV